MMSEVVPSVEADSVSQMRLWAVKLTTKSPSPFLREKPVKTEKHRVMEGETVEDVIEAAVRGSNVWDLKHGVKVEVVEIVWEGAAVAKAKYDKEPMTDNHMATDAKLVVRRKR